MKTNYLTRVAGAQARTAVRPQAIASPMTQLGMNTRPRSTTSTTALVTPKTPPTLNQNKRWPMIPPQTVHATIRANEKLPMGCRLTVCNTQTASSTQSALYQLLGQVEIILEIEKSPHCCEKQTHSFAQTVELLRPLLLVSDNQRSLRSPTRPARDLATYALRRG